MSLDHDLAQATREQTIKEKAVQALKEGKITHEEYAFLLGKEIHTHTLPPNVLHSYANRKSHDDHRRETLQKIIAVLAILAFSFVLLWAFSGQIGLTGLVTLEPTSPVTTPTTLIFTESGTVQLNATNTTSLKVSGTLSGEGTITLLKGAERLLVYQGNAAPPHYQVLTAQESYALNEPIAVTVTPEGTSFTLWLTDEAGDKMLVESGFIPATPGAYELDALINDSDNITMASTRFIVREDEDPANDIARQPSDASIAFTDECVETCEMISTEEPLTLEVEVMPGTTLQISAISTTVPRANSAPIQLQNIPDITVQEGASTALDLGQYFEDPDGDMIIYDLMSVPGATMSIDSSVLTVTGTSPGAEQTVIYASDLYGLVQSNSFTITITPTGTPNATNETTEPNVTETNMTEMNETNTTTSNETINITPANLTLNETVNVTTNATDNATLDCSNSDPNQRPLECLQRDAELYFQEQTILISNDGLTPVARITPIGNLLLTGAVIENEQFTYTPGDYVLTYEDAYGDRHTTVWFETATGNLHLSGNLHEENANLEPAAGSYVLRNKKGITLAWIDTQTGNLYLRGNVVPYRPNIMR